jgi:hypothetical protein
MLVFASVNRFRLTPRLRVSDRALRLLCTSTGAEIVLGLIVICVVAVLGQLEPAGHMLASATPKSTVDYGTPRKPASHRPNTAWRTRTRARLAPVIKVLGIAVSFA